MYTTILLSIGFVMRGNNRLKWKIWKIIAQKTLILTLPVQAEKPVRNSKKSGKIIKSSIPKVEEGISWGVPFYKYHGVLAGFAAFKNHVSFGFAFVLQSKDREMLEEKGYKTGKKTIQIKFDQKAPTTAIKQILKEKAKMNEAKRAMK